MSNRKRLTDTRRWVVKIGSALLTSEGHGLNGEGISHWVSQMAAFRRHGVDVVLVSSGAVAAGMSRLGWKERPVAMHELQVAAAVGQMELAQTWQSAFDQHGIQTAQVLLTHADLSNRERYLNARSALVTMLDLGVIPVINENDTVVTDEIRFGDNDTLGALVANLVEADVLAILTDQQGMFTVDPRTDPDAELINEACASDDKLDAVAGSGGGKLGRGGMATKLRAARLAARSGAKTLIVGGRIDNVLERLHEGEPLGTLMLPDHAPEAARKRWLAGQLRVQGKLVIDAGAVRALRESGRSLLPVGVRRVDGRFQRGEMVACVDESGNEIARGLVNYGSDDARMLAGHASHQIVSILGYIDEPELLHRDNLVLV